MKTMTLIPLAAIGLAGAATAALPALYEEQMARVEEARIIQSPIAGIKNTPQCTTLILR